MEPEELSRALGKILGSRPFTMDERDRINDAFGEEGVDSIEDAPKDIQELLNRPLPEYRSPSGVETRAVRLSTLNRQIIKDSDKCPQCVANNDPRNVPVHPNCHCDVVTDEVETGVVDSGSRLLDVLRTGQDLLQLEAIGANELPAAVQLNPETVAVFDPEDVRFADLARWLEQMQPYLDASEQYVAIVVDEDSGEALEEIEGTLEAIAQDPEQIAQALRNKKLWFAIGQAVI
jgi:hypothetical protein